MPTTVAYPWHQDGNQERLVESHLGLAHHLARRYSNRGEALEDLVQVASLGLVKAAERFDPERGISFPAYAVPTILGELRRHFRDHGWATHLPRDVQEASLKVDRALAMHRGAPPTPAQLAQQTGLDLEAVLEALEASGARRAVSLDAPGAPGDDGAGAPLIERLGDKDAALDRADERATVERLAAGLSPREREVLRLRFVADLTQSQIGARLGLSQMRVSRLIRTALDRMRLETQARRPLS